MIERATGATEYLQFERLSRQEAVAHAVFTRKRGYSRGPWAGLNGSGTTGDDVTDVRKNRQAASEAVGLPLIWAKPVHGAATVFVDRERAGGAPEDRDALARLHERLRVVEADAMVTDVPGLALAWSFGDCTPVLLYDTRHQAVALIHSGWRGAAAGIVPLTVAAMRARYGTRPAELLAGIGPAIGACCYEVRENVREAFQADALARETAVFATRALPGEDAPRLWLDVRETTRRQALAAGILPEHLEDSGYCTGCRTDLFYSHRRDPWPSGRFLVAIGLRAESSR